MLQTFIQCAQVRPGRSDNLRFFSASTPWTSLGMSAPRRSCAGLASRLSLSVSFLLICFSIAGLAWKFKVSASTLLRSVYAWTQAGTSKELSEYSEHALSGRGDDDRPGLAAHGLEEEAWLLDPDPPRLDAHNMKTYRHSQFLNEEYVAWAHRNLRPLQYDEEKGMFSYRWSEIPDPVPEDENEIILLTQTSVSRLHAFKWVATEWGGPISLSVFIPFQMGTLEASSCRSTVRDFMRNYTKQPTSGPIIMSLLYNNYEDPAASCAIPHGRGVPKGKENKAERALYIARGRTAGALTRRKLLAEQGRHLTYTGVGASTRPFKEAYDMMYPVNRLRNLAWSQLPKRGAFVFLLDIDFVPTKTLYPGLKQGRWATKLKTMREAFELRESRQALVVPAFERMKLEYQGNCKREQDCDFINVWETPRSLERLQSAVDERVVQIFHADKFVGGHGCYDGQYWLHGQRDDELVAFNYTHPCEPYAIGLSEAMPRYDERFRGRGMNKVEQLTHMAMWGFTWELLPRDFVLHMPHPLTEGADPPGGWDRIVAPLVLMKHEMREIQQEAEFRQHIVQDIPSAR